MGTLPLTIIVTEISVNDHRPKKKNAPEAAALSGYTMQTHNC